VRRVEAVTGEGAYRLVQEQERELREVASVVKSTDLKVAEKVKRLSDEAKDLRKELKDIKGKVTGADPLASDRLRVIGGVKVLTWLEEGKEPDDLRALGDQLRDRLGSGIVFLGSAKDGKVSLLCMVTRDLVDRFKAGAIIKEAAALVGGSGGGRPDMAMAGGKDPSRLPEALDKVYEIAGR
jgi:alanyl-tRNA synthetase